MYTSGKSIGRRAVSIVVAAAIVAVSGLALDRGHAGAAQSGVVEIGALAPVDVLPRNATLPEIVVTAPRLAMVQRKRKV